MKFLITLPVLNEEDRIQNGVNTLMQFLASHKIDAMVEIVDNGSSDRTVEIAKNLAQQWPTLRTLVLKEKGVGRALKASWDKAEEAVVGYMDIDLSTDLRHFLEVVKVFELNSAASLVNGSRLLPSSSVTGRKFSREISSRGLNFILRRLLGIKFTDAMCGFKFIKRANYEVLRKEGLENNQWFFNAELLIRSEWKNFKIVEIPVEWTDDGNSRAKIIKLSFEYMGHIFGLMKIKPKNRQQK